MIAQKAALILTSFEECAKKAEKDGNFIFYFSGHGAQSEVQSQTGGCNLGTIDYSVNGGISGDDLVQCLNNAECKASNIILIFDCCFAGSLGKSLTSHEEWNITAKAFVMCACAALEKSLSMNGVLENSMFTYFLLDFFRTTDCKKEFEFQRAANDISMLCKALSSLILKCSKDNDSTDSDSTDSAPCNTLGNLQFNPEAWVKKLPNFVNEVMISNEEPVIASLEKLLTGDGKSINDKLATAVQQWLSNVNTNASLKTLSSKASSAELLQKAIVSVLLGSSTVVYCQDAAASHFDKKLLGKRNVFLKIAIMVSNRIDFFKVKIDHVKMGLKFYYVYVEKIEENAKLEIDVSKLHSLFGEMNFKFKYT